MQWTYSKPWYGRYNYTIICKYQIHWNRLKNMKVKVGGLTANLEFLIENQRGLQITDVWTQLCLILMDCACSLGSLILISQSECSDVLCSFLPIPGELVWRPWNGILGLVIPRGQPSSSCTTNSLAVGAVGPSLENTDFPGGSSKWEEFSLSLEWFSQVISRLPVLLQLWDCWAAAGGHQSLAEGGVTAPLWNYSM